MKKTKTVAFFQTCVVAVALGSSAAFAQDPAPATAAPAPAAALKPANLGLIVYPGSGQDAAQQAKDENECYGWARQQTAQAQDTATKDTFKKAWGACLEGRKYTVK